MTKVFLFKDGRRLDVGIRWRWFFVDLWPANTVNRQWCTKGFSCGLMWPPLKTWNHKGYDDWKRQHEQRR